MVVPGGVGGMVKVQASALSAWLSALPPAFLIRRLAIVLDAPPDALVAY